MTVFKKKLKLQFIQEQQSTRDHKIREWFSKWDRTIAAITAIIVFCALLILVVVNTTVSDKNDSASDGSTKKGSTDTFIIPYPREIISNCRMSQGLECSNIAAKDLCAHINSWVQTNHLDTVDNLVLTNIQFEQFSIEEGWLNCCLLKFTKLTINKQLYDIGKSAFNGVPFGSLNYLVLNTELDKFRRNMFEGINRLNTLEIDCYGTATDVEENAFGTLSRTMQVLQIQQCLYQGDSEDLISKITGSSESLQALSRLVLSYNDLPKIKGSSFISAPVLKELFLGFSGIKEIDVDAFKPHSLVHLYLTDNELSTLPEGIFKDVEKGISVRGNRWECDCKLFWLKKMYLDRRGMFMDEEFYCQTAHGPILYKEYTFCESDTTTTTSTVTPTTTTTTPTTTTTSTTTTTTVSPAPPTPSLLSIKCTNLLSPSESISDDSTTIKVSNGSVTMTLDLKSNDPPIYLLQINGNLSDNSILWCNANKTSECGCIKKTKDGGQVEIKDLINGGTYIFCVKDSDPKVAPSDCGGMTVPLRYEDEPWIVNKDMIAVICGAVGSLILATAISGLIAFYCIRQHPSLIKGNKSVIVVESETAGGPVMPSTYYDEISYYAPSLNDGYITPTHHRVSNLARNSPHPRTISENVVVVPSSSNGEGRYKRRTKMRHVTQAFDEHVYEPPPLPPNHPTGLIHNDSLNRNSTRV